MISFHLNGKNAFRINLDDWKEAEKIRMDRLINLRQP